MIPRWKAAQILLLSLCFGIVLSHAATDDLDVDKFDGETTFCWGLHASVSSSEVTEQQLFASGSNTQCPLSLAFVQDNKKSYTVNEKIPLMWMTTMNETNNAVFSARNAAVFVDSTTGDPVSTIFTNIYAFNDDKTCSLFANDLEKRNISLLQDGTLVQSNGKNVTFTATDVSFQTAGSYFLMAHVILPSAKTSERFDFAAFLSITIEDNVAQEATEQPQIKNESSSSESSVLGMPVLQFTLIVVFVVVTIICVIIMVIMVVQRRRQQSKLKSTCVASTRITGESQGRFSDWCDLLSVTQERDQIVASSTEGENSNNLAILRASCASSSCSSLSPHYHKRKVADFTRDIARWDLRPSASPITPSSSLFLRDISPIDGFVPLETLGDRSRVNEGLQAVSSSEDEQEIDV